MAAADNDWFGNLIMAWLYYYIIVIVGYAIPIGPIMVLLGTPSWLYDFMAGFNLLPPDATSWETAFY